MIPRVAPLALLLVAGLALPSTLAQAPPVINEADVIAEILKTPGKEVTFYGHIFTNGRQDGSPMNTQFPDGEDDFSRGFSTACGQPPPAPADNADCRAGLDLNENYWYSTAGFVQVKNSDEWGGDFGLFHNERGLTKDVYLDTGMTPRATYHMSADWFGWPVAACGVICFNWDPGYFPGWTIEATLYHVPLGELHSSPSEKPEFDLVISEDPSAVKMAFGVSEPVDMLSFDYETPAGGGKTVYAYSFDLAWEPTFDGKVPLTDNIVVKWEWYEKQGENEFIIGSSTGLAWNINSGEDYPSNVVLPVRNPIDVELVYPQFIHDKLVFLSVINTPWGSYDLDPELIKLIIKDESGNLVVPSEENLAKVVEQSVAHSGHYNPIKPTWVWDYQGDELKPGDYTVTVEATNFQHSVTASTTAKFTVTPEGAGETEVGQSGIQTLKGNIHAGHEGTSADPNVANSTATAPATTTEKSPGLAVPVLGAAMLAVAVLLRRRTK